MSRPERESRATGPFQAGASSGRPERQPMPPPLLQTQPSTDSYAKSEYTVDSADPKSSSRPMFQTTDSQQQVSFEQDLRQDAGPSSAAGGGSGATGVGRKKSLVRPERARVDPDHRLWNYRNHAAAMQADGTGDVGFSRTGHYPQAGLGLEPHNSMHNNAQGGTLGKNRAPLRRGVSILARDQPTDGAGILRRGTTIRKSKGRVGRTEELQDPKTPPKQPLGPWMIYVKILTCCCPSPLLSLFGMKTKDRQSAWKEKMGILGINAILMAFVGFLTFGFTETVCGEQRLRFESGSVASGSMIFHGWTYSMDRFEHPAASGIEENSNPLYQGDMVGGMDGSFLFQIVNQRCLDIITPAADTGIPTDGNRMAWYFPCNFFNQYGTSDVNTTGYTEGRLCHTQDDARNMFYSTRNNRVNGMLREGQVYFKWNEVRNETRNLGVFDGNVLDFNLLNWLDPTQVNYPELFDELARGNSSYKGQDITMQVIRTADREYMNCLTDVIRVGAIDADSIGCMASQVVLYASLIVILGVVAAKFFMAVIFGWFVSRRFGRYKQETEEQRRARFEEIENWAEDIYRPAPSRYRPNANKKGRLPTKSRFSTAIPSLAAPKQPMPSRQSLYAGNKPIGAGMRNSPPASPARSSPSSINFAADPAARQSTVSLDSYAAEAIGCPFPLHNVVPQPPPDYEPFNFPLAHSFCVVTAYSESPEGLRTTLDSIATSDYPNSHKCILVIADGIVKGSGNQTDTPDIVLAMMKEMLEPVVDEVKGNSYVAIAHGHKRHNQAKVHAGFYSYDNNTVEPSKQQRVPMILVTKCGNPLEHGKPKAGNRGKRDSQVLLMTFLQKVMFDERMTLFEYEFFNAIWRVTGICPDQYQTCLMVDADTKVFPDALTRMNCCMVQDPEIMGLCGETKIANKTQSWVTAIQVFEYYLAHHQTKAFEAMFGGVTCLPGCFSMYRIKTPKGADNYWVPVIANPDIVEHYSENVVDTLHKKNLLLLGEDRYLSTLMLKTFPRRKMMFCPQAVCKTVVPDTFKTLLSQRRRWINSTVHNLFELLLVRDLCGTFCFSMQFVVFMDLVGTMVLPAAIAFTLYILSISCMPNKTKPTISLILLAFILGLPGVLIVVTSRKWIYVGWMFIYLCSLPIWNFIFPVYSFLHMDDFSWGATRMVEGEEKGNHGDKEGEFDSSHIVMKRWAEYERDRRRRAARAARDASYTSMLRPGDQTRADSMESSVESYSATGHPVLRNARAPAQPVQSVPFDYSSTYGRRVDPSAPGSTAPSADAPGLNPADQHSSSESVPRAPRQHYPQPDWQTNPETSGAAESQPILTQSPEMDPASPITAASDLDIASQEGTSQPRRMSRYGGGVSLRDDGPIPPSAPGARTVQKGRQSSQAGRRQSGSVPALPPGARLSK